MGRGMNRSTRNAWAVLAVVWVFLYFAAVLAGWIHPGNEDTVILRP